MRKYCEKSLQGFRKVFAKFFLGFQLRNTRIFAGFRTFSQFLQPMRLNDSMCIPGPAFSEAAPKSFNFSGKHREHHPIYRSFMFEPSVHIILHVWLLRKCNDRENVELLRTWGMLANWCEIAKSMWNCEIASNSQILFSTAESSSPHVPHRVCNGKTFTVSCVSYGNNLEIDVKLWKCSQHSNCNVICESAAC